MFKQGLILERFKVKKNNKTVEVIFRYPKKTDTNALLENYNKIISETDFLSRQKKVTLKEEKKWLLDTLKKMKKKDKIMLLIEVNKKIIGAADIDRHKEDTTQHRATFGIAMLQEFTGLGIGPRLSKLIMNLGKKEMNLELIMSSYFKGNRPSEKLHKRLGFRLIGKMPKARKRKAGYQKEVFVYKLLN